MSWKFNKKKQKDLLKNLFNIFRIPSAYDQALLAYIAGLQGIGAQQRVIESAEAVLKALLEKQEISEDDKGTMESLKARMETYDAALEREMKKLERSGGGQSEYDEQQLEEIRNEVQKGHRANAVLSQLLPSESQSFTTSTTARTETSTASPGIATPSSATGMSGSTSTSTKITGKKSRKSRTEASSDDESDSSSSVSTSSSESEGG